MGSIDKGTGEEIGLVIDCLAVASEILADEVVEVVEAVPHRRHSVDYRAIEGKICWDEFGIDFADVDQTDVLLSVGHHHVTFHQLHFDRLSHPHRHPHNQNPLIIEHIINQYIHTSAVFSSYPIYLYDYQLLSFW